MKKGYFLILAAFAMVLAAPLAQVAYGHGLGQDQTAPVTVGDRQVAVMGSLSPSAIPFDNSSRPTLFVRTFDQGQNSTIGGIDYSLTILLRNETVLQQRFHSPDGIILATLVPDEAAQRATITGHESAPASQAVDVSQSSPVEIRSKVLARGGLYHLEVTLEKSSPGLALDRDTKFDLFISVSYPEQFSVQADGGSAEMSVRTYYDDVKDFSYDNGTISFAMPFNWDLGNVNQVPYLHMEVLFPRTVKGLQANSYNGSINGVMLPASAVQIDDYSSKEDRIVHFLIPNDRLVRIAKAAGDANAALFELKGVNRPRFPIDLLTSPSEKFLVEISWGPEVIESGQPETFVMNVQDPATGDLLRGASFDFVISQSGKEVYRERLQSDFGTFAKTYTFSQAGIFTFSAANVNGQPETAKLDLVVLQGSGGSISPGQGGQPAGGNTTTQQPSGCLIATAAFGSELTPQVQFLRNFREQYILSTASGSAFMQTFNSIYYSFSPQVADYERGQPWLQSAVRTAIYPLFGILMASEQAHFAAGGGEGGAVAAGTVASVLIGSTYLLPAGVAVSGRVRTKWIIMSMAASAAFLAVTIFAVHPLLPFSTAALVATFAGAASLLAAKPALRLIRRVR